MATTDKRVPADIVEVMKVFPKDAMTPNVPFAVFTAIRVWAFFLFSVYLTSVAPWYLLPFAWFFQGTCMTGLFVVGHDCAHQSFSKSRTLNEVVGTLCYAPLAFPYNGWELTHNHHHAFANHIDKDHLWRPIKKEELEKMSPLKRKIAYYMYGPLFFESSILHHAYHFVLPFVSKKNRVGVSRSIFFALAGLVATCWIVSHFGSVFSLWIMPFLAFQFWLSTFTYFHHRNPNGVGWKDDEDWNKLYGSLLSTVHVDYPSWVEFLTLDINWHLPHHVSPLIPWYNLRKCTYALMMKYGDVVMVDEFGWKLWKETTTGCHMYDKQKGYAPMFENQKK